MRAQPAALHLIAALGSRRFHLEIAYTLAPRHRGNVRVHSATARNGDTICRAQGVDLWAPLDALNKRVTATHHLTPTRHNSRRARTHT